ncbi:MAG TPA: zinc ribbon domain-containing protein [Gemmatimonadaceae bacterium]|nr:zinc ribbon domain-containing protein [Gemmatimonadaceae bacterium]
MSKAANAGTACPSCGTVSRGKFCADCGAALQGVTCASCHAPLTPGARFCHNCGSQAGAVSAASGGQRRQGAAPAQLAPSRSVLPWVVGFVALFALVIVVAVQQRDAAPASAGPNMSLDGSGPAGGGAAAPFAGGGGMRAPDISSMSPRERADRLYDRVMRLASEGKSDSASFFATMAAQSYEMLGTLDDDLKYDHGRMSEMAGDLATAQKEADAILANNPDHLLGLILSARVAQLKNDSGRYATLMKRVLAVEKTERAKAIEEYSRHQGDIDAALQEARSIK